MTGGHADAVVVDELVALHARAALTPAEVAAVPDARTVGPVTPRRHTPRLSAGPGGRDVDHARAEPAPAPEPPVTLTAALAARRTSREAAPEPFASAQLGMLLHHAARATPEGRRPHPSAGAAYPVSIDVVALRCDGLPTGVHRYDPVAHGLVTRAAGPLSDALVTAAGRTWVGDARAWLVIVADLDVAARTHGARGYRYALLEAGHLAQSLLLLCAAEAIPACPLGGFADAYLATSLGLPDTEVALTAVVV